MKNYRVYIMSTGSGTRERGIQTNRFALIPPLRRKKCGSGRDDKRTANVETRRPGESLAEALSEAERSTEGSPRRYVPENV
jgi:hypothetical protein